MKKTTLLIFFLLALFSLQLTAQELLTRLIAERKWPELAVAFADDSHAVLPENFRNFQSIEFVELQANRFLYKVKYADFAEIGNLSFSKENNLYAQLKLDNQITPLYFIDGFRKYAVTDRVLAIGDARIHFEKGFLYQAWPAQQPLLFEGRWRFQLTPADSEERLTLARFYRQETFSQANETGIFVLEDFSVLKELPLVAETVTLDSPALQKAHQLYQSYFGFPIKQFNEIWYLPIADNDNLLIFAKGKDTFYLYDFNSQLTPDTQLRESDSNRIILSYNAVKEMKLSFKRNESLSSLSLTLFYNPEERMLSGTSTLVFEQEHSFRSLSLGTGLKIKASIDLNAGNISVVRKNDLYYVLGPKINRLAFFYSGSIQHDDRYSDLLAYKANMPFDQPVDKFYFLSQAQKFYPNPGYDFCQTSLSVSLPDNMNCLASGTLVETNPIQGRNVFKFTSPGSKGIAMVCGDFKKAERLETRIPINVFAQKNFNYEYYLAHKEMKNCLDFLIDRFGPLETPEINVLFRRWKQDGGVSNQGFVVLNIDESNAKMIRDIGPMIFTKSRSEYFLHELAHQWWGGRISWSSYRDEWITEGVATMATILYLREKLSAGRYRDTLERIKKWVFKYADCGPVAYGLRVANLEGNYESFQSVVYLKGALVLLMLEEMLGAEELFKRLQTCLEKFKYKSVASNLLINEISKKEDWLLHFFKGWLYSRRLPEITYRVQLQGGTAELRVRQKDTDFVFPLRVSLETAKGKKILRVIVRQKEQVFTFSEEAAIESLKVESHSAPVLIKD